MRMDMPRPNNGTRKDRKENIDMSIVSKKSKQIPGSLIREMFAMQAGMKDVISFALGEPDFTAPQHVVDATVASFRRGETHYTPNTGIPALRKLSLIHISVNVPTGCSFHTRCPYKCERCTKEDPVMREVEPGHTVRCHLIDK